MREPQVDSENQIRDATNNEGHGDDANTRLEAHNAKMHGTGKATKRVNGSH